AAPAAPPPEAPPAPPTDPAAIALLATLQNICIPATEGGSYAKLAKANGWRKSGDTFTYKGQGFQFSINPSPSNPTDCEVEITSAVDPESPAKPLVIALHNWAALERGYSLYRNDKNVTGGLEYITRSWEHDDPGKHEALVLTTTRKADDTPMKRDADTSEMIYSETKTST
ncbi:MAG TPA: hypothetical protein VGS12_02555, partial [Caulobacteraceae bacterium]|nr:hypothetical protein [Caulobacteraceae bacterium]